MATIVITKDNPRPSEEEIQRITEKGRHDTIKLYSGYVRKLKGKRDEKSRLEREIYQAIVDQEKGKIPYSKLDAIRERNNKLLEPYEEAERMQEKQKHKEQGIRARVKGHEILKNDIDARFIKEFNLDKPTDPTFKEDLRDFKKQEPTIGLRMDASHIVGLVVNDQFFQNKKVNPPTVIDVDPKKLTMVMDKVNEEGYRPQIVKLDDSAYDIDLVRKALRTLDTKDPVYFSTIGDTPDRPLLLTDTRGNRIAIAPKIVGDAYSFKEEREKKLKEIPSITEIGEVKAGFSAKIPPIPRGTKLKPPPKPKPLTEKTLPKGYKAPMMTWGKTPPPSDIATPITLPEKKSLIESYTKREAQSVVKRLRPYVGHKVYVFGGGGAGYELVRLDSIHAIPVRNYARREQAPFESNWKGVKVIDGYRFPTNAININMKGEKGIGAGQPTYSLPDEYDIVPSLNGLGSEGSRYTEVKGYNKQKEPIIRKRNFEPHLMSWNLAIPNIYLQKKAKHRAMRPRKKRVGAKASKPKISIHRTKRKKLSRKKVESHRAIRDTCIYCQREHSTDRHRFHGRGSYLRSHGGGSKKRREERIL